MGNDMIHKKNTSSPLLELHQHHIQLALIIFFITLFCTFFIGYFWGKRVAVQELCQQFKQESFADKIYSSLYALSDSTDETEEQGQEESSQADIDCELYKVELEKFSTYASAKKYTEALKKRAIETTIVERSSTNAKGAKKWYIVITTSLDKESATSLLEVLKKTDHLQRTVLVKVTA